MEPIKQEIINNIFENGDKLITGPILQTVLIDMIDDVNVKDQEILSKTGSWDEAVTQIPNLATKAEVTNLSESVARDLENKAEETKTWVQGQDYANKAYVNETKSTLESSLNSLSESVARDLENVDLTGYATETWVQNQGYLKEHQDISGLATKTELTEAENNLQTNITNLSESVARDLANVDVDLTGYATETWVQSQDYASKSYVDNAVSSSSVDLTGYATETWVESQGYLKEHQDISNLATKSELNSVSESIQTDITNLSESVANSAVWKKGTGTDSIVQKLTDTGLIEPIATGKGAVATGIHTTASGGASHAEGEGTKALDAWSHAEGNFTVASGRSSHAEGEETVASIDFSHAEGYCTIATNAAEHAQGQYNYTSSNQIFSIGIGENDTNRRNAVSVLAVPNADSKLLTASFFVQNIGGYDGTNPTPGTNDLATVINGLSSGGGSSETLWKKGEGPDSVVQVLSGDMEADTSIATDIGAVAIGVQTTASGMLSHAEGIATIASGMASHAEGAVTTASNDYSHAEGVNTEASGYGSHAEGYGTKALNNYEHAQGMFNHSSENQIFSIGVGEGDPSNPETATRRNAIAVIAPWDNKTGMPLPYFFVKGVGSYDGTNPEPGINDLATVISDLPSGGGGSSETLWKKGEGQGSIVQKIASGTDFPTATGTGSIAIGWSTIASGSYSHAEGSNTKAEGSNSHAEGWSTKALGNNSHAEGETTKALGNNSHAEGIYAEASGEASHAEGQNTNASGNYSHAEGRYTTASGMYSHAEGKNTIASGSWSHAEGTGSKASGEGSHAEGYKVIATGKYGHAEGYFTTASGQDSHAEGYRSNASGHQSHAEGSSTNASGDSSHAEGYQTIASEAYSHAEGYQTIASNFSEHAQGRYNHNSENQIFSIGTGNSNSDRRNVVSVLEVSNNNSYTGSVFVQNVGGYDGTNPTPGTNDLATVINGLSSSGGSSETLWKKGTGKDSLVQVLTGDDEAYTPTATGKRAIAIGYATTASGDNSYAEGNSTASGSYSHAEGHGTLASGIASHAEGYYTTASNTSEHAQGRFNHSSENQIFSVGAGEWGDISNPLGNRRNAISVLAVPNADTKINTASFFVQNIGGYDGTNPEPGTNDLATVINGMSSSGGSSETLWKKGEGVDSIVQVIADGTNLPTATGDRAIATGFSTKASGYYSHAEGSNTEASDKGSHAEGDNSRTGGMYSHAEGGYTITSNLYEHAQGKWNHTSTNQIFSVGAGDFDSRRNAVSVLAVDNNYKCTASVFVQNIGGYDGTNPLPGTNDLATVINGISSSGGTGTSTETWTFTLEDGSTVTKNIVMR